MEQEILSAVSVITNNEDRLDAKQHLKMKLINQAETIKTKRVLKRFLNNRMYWFLIVNKAQGLTFNGRPTGYEQSNYNNLPRPEFVKLPYNLVNNRIISNKKKLRKLVIWIIDKWLRQC